MMDQCVDQSDVANNVYTKSLHCLCHPEHSTVCCALIPFQGVVQKYLIPSFLRKEFYNKIKAQGGNFILTVGKLTSRASQMKVKIHLFICKKGLSRN